VKPLLAEKITRDNVANPVREWSSAAHHATHDGQVEFHARMQARIKAAQPAAALPAPAKAPAIPIRRRAKQ
jgi:hypothetical protein